jgi:DNA mismatch repair protein MSH5
MTSHHIKLYIIIHTESTFQVYLRSIFRQVAPSFLVASGPNEFLQDLLEFLNIDGEDGKNIDKFMVKKSKMANAIVSNMTFYTFDRKNQQNLEALRKKIFSLDLPGLPSDASSSDRKIFMESVFPMKQELLIISLGNLLRYLGENVMKWRHVFLNLDVTPIITNVLLSLVESQVLLDDMTFNSLSIFTNIYHPSSFKIQIRKDGLSLYNLLNQCSSSSGSKELKNMLKQPTRNANEINLRLATVEWCLKKENAEHVLRIKHFLTGFININASFQRILKSHGKSIDWKSFKRTVYNASSICELCASLPDSAIKDTLLKQLAMYCKEEQTVNGILFALDKVVDLEAIDEKKKFCVKKGIDTLLDQKIESLNGFTENCNEMDPDETLLSLNDSLNAFQYVFYAEMGFAIGTTLQIDQLNMSLMKENGIELMLQTDSAIYFKTPNCVKLNAEYEEKFTEIITHEMKVFNKLIIYIKENFAELAEIAKLCAKLDCLFAFASVAAKNRYVKPVLREGRSIEIVRGRHPLVEQMKVFVPSTTIINEQNIQYINIIRAPNSSGKSIYVKQVAMIAYMAHIGCYVPCDSCSISLLHSIYTRIYTPESISSNESAFMSDIQQMSKVVMNSTPRTLILIDEFGKGTHYKDGISLLTATIEHFIERGRDITPFVFITTHYAQVYDLLATKEFTCLKTIVTTKNESNIFQSTFTLTDGSNDQVCTEYPESQAIISNIFKQNRKDGELKRFNDGCNTAVRAFVLVMARMMIRKGVVTRDFLNDMYTKVDIENFLSR